MQSTLQIRNSLFGRRLAIFLGPQASKSMTFVELVEPSVRKGQWRVNVQNLSESDSFESNRLPRDRDARLLAIRDPSGQCSVEPREPHSPSRLAGQLLCCHRFQIGFPLEEFRDHGLRRLPWQAKGLVGPVGQLILRQTGVLLSVSAYLKPLGVREGGPRMNSLLWGVWRGCHRNWGEGGGDTLMKNGKISDTCTILSVQIAVR